ncbi:hypothetical protein FZC79_13385 [Rossellomorea vietnamensis]|uniref:Uncharacterized protein n=1 Tax=Rossellomorea vietnamensis TaxID=218284 RepID=A0A5D4KC64_9BACI|nr:hypothetical protein [Rossellomorea vietnamensis]TYR74469.1 hypothetical protein FZC79_13385 [Rossellomorea vietnamensis]
MLKKILELSNLETTISLRQKELLELEEKIEEKKRVLKQLSRKARKYEEYNAAEKEVAVSVALEAEPVSVSEKKIGVIARTDLVRLLESGRVPQSVIESLKDQRYSKDTFDLNFPLLKEITDMGKMDELGKDHTGRNRYYAKPITIQGKKYLVCAQWYDRSKAKLVRWIGKY